MEEKKTKYGKFLSIGKDIIFWVVLFGSLLLISWWIFSPLQNYDGIVADIIFCLHLFLFLTGVGVFGILRMYNSIVANTRFSIKLREAILKLQKELPALDRMLKVINSALGGNSSALRKLDDAVGDLKNSIDLNTDKKER